MVRRRATDRSAHEGSKGSGDDVPAEGEAQLRAWVGGWLGSVNGRVRGGAEWLFSGEQVRELLGVDIYPYASPGPTREHLDRIVDILGPHVVSAMLKIWRSPHTRVFANALVADVEDFTAYVADVAWLEGDEEAVVELESVFPRPRPRPLGYEEQLVALEARSREHWVRTVAERERVREKGARSEVEGGGVAGKWE
jgi:hypothetical protein